MPIPLRSGPVSQGVGGEERADGHREVGRTTVALVELAQSFK